MAEIDFSELQKIYCNDNDVIEAYYNGNKIFGAKVSFPALNEVVYNAIMDTDSKRYASASTSSTYQLKGIENNALKIDGINIGTGRTVVLSGLMATYSASFLNGTLTLTTSARVTVTQLPVTIRAMGVTFDLQPA